MAVTINDKEFVRLLSDLEGYTANDLQTIEQLLERYPFCQAFHYVYSSALRKLKSDKFDSALQRSAAYSPVREMLFQYVEHPGEVRKVLDDKKDSPLPLSAYDLEKAASQTAAISVETVESPAQDPVAEPLVMELIQHLTEQSEPSEAADSTLLSENHTREASTEKEGKDSEPENSLIKEEDDEVFEEISEVDFTQTDVKDAEHSANVKDVEDETFEEVAEVETLETSSDEEIADEQAEDEIEGTVHSELITEASAEMVSNHVHGDSLADQIETVIPDFEWPDFKLSGVIQEVEEPAEESEYVLGTENPVVETSEESVELPQEKLIVDSIAARDYFVFDKSSVDPLKTEESETPDNPLVLKPGFEEAEQLAKYHDETLPFTFLWWLHKTRKAHDVTYQPYLAQNRSFAHTPATTDLNQQIIESIFHHQPELKTFPEASVEAPPVEIRKKEDELIERFIKDEPQIKPPLATKLDNENKARKSSEDNLDLVSETLAKIYIDQMLYHKAIDTYKKLSLKFPEKSAYFAAQISDLEKIIN